MRPFASRLLTSTLVVVALLFAASLGAGLRPSDAGAQGRSTAGSRYQIVVLSPAGAPQPEWLLLDAETGKVQHWRDEVTHYLVISEIHSGRNETIRTRVPKGRGVFMPPDTGRIR